MRSFGAGVSGAPIVLSVLLACQSPPVGPVAQRATPLTGAAATDGYPAVGILSFLSPERLRFCTGTLVGHCWVLTAAHCVDDADTTAEGMRFHTALTLTSEEVEKNNTGITVERFAINPTYGNSGDTRTGDAALVRLTDGQCPLTAPMPVARRAPTAGLALTLVGYGTTAWGADDDGTRRVGTSLVDEVEQHEFTLRADGEQSLICSGDSGGPAFVEIDGRLHQIGVHSRGDLTNPCRANSTQYEARVDQNVAWLLAESSGQVLAESDADQSPPTVTFQAPLDGAAVPAAPNAFEVLVNAEDDTKVQYVDLYVQGAHIKRLAGPPYRVESVVVERADAVWIEAVAMDATGRETRASVTVRATVETIDLTTPDAPNPIDDATPSTPDRPGGKIDTLTGSSGCAVATPSQPSAAASLLCLMALLALTGRRRGRP